MAYGQPPQQPYSPRPPYGPPPRRKGMPPALLAGLIAAPIIVIVIVIGALLPDDQAPVAVRTSATAASPVPASSSAAPAFTSAIPRPTSEQERVYLAALARIDPGLAVKPTRVIGRARNICQRILQPAGGNLTLEKYTVLELSGGNATINEAQARQVIRAVKVWCHR